MVLKDRTFIDNRTGEKVKIIDSYNDIAITESKSRIDTKRLLDPQFYTEEVDPQNFFNNPSTLNAFAEKIKSIDTTNLPEDGPITPNMPTDPAYAPTTNESAVIYQEEDPEAEAAELLRKYGHSSSSNNDVQKQQDAFDKLLNDDQPQPVRANPQTHQQPQTSARVVETGNTNIPQTQQYQAPQPVDPMVAMFKNIKRNKKFNLSIDISEKIPRKDFIEMMEDSYERSIIEFLADEFTNKILRDPSLIRNKIIKGLEELVYPDGKPIDENETLEQVEEIIGKVSDEYEDKSSQVVDPEKKEPIMINEDFLEDPIEERIEELTKNASIDELLDTKTEVEEGENNKAAIEEIKEEVENLVKKEKEKKKKEKDDK